IGVDGARGGGPDHLQARDRRSRGTRDAGEGTREGVPGAVRQSLHRRPDGLPRRRHRAHRDEAAGHRGLRRAPDEAYDATAGEAREHPALSRRHMFRRLLIANRGEIAIRVARTARAMGIHCIGVYSEADRTALHRTAMDESVEIGGPLPAQSYLNASAMLRAATETRADAIHPGYGFLSEKADFAMRCADRKSTRLNSS